MFVRNTNAEGAEGRKQPSYVHQAMLAGFIGVVVLTVILVTRFVAFDNDLSNNQQLLTTAPPIYEEDFSNVDANEQGRICEILSTVLISEEQSADATTKYVRLGNGRLVSRVFEPAYGPSVSSFKAVLTSTSTTSAGSKIIEDSMVVFTQNPDTKTTTLDVEAPEGFSVVQVGAIVTDTADGLSADFVDPAPTVQSNSFYDYVSSVDGRTLSLPDVKSWVLGGAATGDESKLCGTDASQADPSTEARCAGPYFIYSYAKVCKDDSVATTGSLIDIVFVNTLADTTKVAFEAARDSWNGIIKNTFPEAVLSEDQTTINCNGRTLTFPAGTRTLDGLMIFAMVHSIDGPGGILAQAGPCAYSDGQFGFLLPRVGLMEFDIEDVEKLYNAGTLSDVVKHEMAHVLGLGVHWDDVDLIEQRSSNDPRYIGANGIKGYKTIRGADEIDIPVANTGGQGTAGGHWRESTFGEELMTGYASGANTLSIMTIRSLQDLGFMVDITKAEDYVLPGSTSFGSDSDSGVGGNLVSSMSVSKLETLEPTPELQDDTFSSANLLKLELAGEVQEEEEEETQPTPATPTKQPTASPVVKNDNDDDDDDDDAQGGGRRLRKQKRISSVVMPRTLETTEWSGVLPLGK